ncbi:MAG: hypothetical protein DHS20C15_27840 [Planctomycetota bacterium]|nr:MAG: hypothetical protein DHS20C15_27840 [Planctomycetota bacterium]
MTTTADLGPVLDDLELQAHEIEVADVADHASLTGAALGESRTRLLVLPGEVGDLELAALRDRLWPQAHVTAVYRISEQGAVKRQALAKNLALPGEVSGPARTLLYVRSRADALGRSVTVAKFDANAEGWNGVPGAPTYGHYRWMRRLLAVVAKPTAGLRCLDAGCGAGWVGIEAAKLGAQASAFDPSPEMVRIASDNAASEGVPLDARVGFVEDVPFKDPFDLVLNSGVISFAPDADDYLNSLDALVAPGGTLVIGDLNPLARGFKRRRKRPLLPARELNGIRRDDVEQRLRERGYHCEGRWYYQLSFPIPEMMTVSEQRWNGLGCGLALLANKAATAIDHGVGSSMASQFDSWILKLSKAP